MPDDIPASTPSQAHDQQRLVRLPAEVADEVVLATMGLSVRLGHQLSGWWDCSDQAMSSHQMPDMRKGSPDDEPSAI
jgi:hypothetical protein